MCTYKSLYFNLSENLFLCHRNVSNELLERIDSKKRGVLLPITRRGQWGKATHDVH